MGVTLLALNTAYTTASSDPADLPTVKAPAAELKGTEIGPDGKSYGVWWVTNPQPGVQPGKYLVDEIGTGRVPDRFRHRRAADQDGLGDADPEVQPAPAAALRHVDRRDHDPEAALGAGDPGGGAGDRDATGRRVGAGVRRRRLPAAVDHAADLRRRRAPRLVDRARGLTPEEAETSPGTLMSTGLIAGGSLAGIIIALLVVFEEFGKKIDFSTPAPPAASPAFLVPAIAAFTVMAVALFAVALLGKRPVADPPSKPGKVVFDDIGLQEGP